MFTPDQVIAIMMGNPDKETCVELADSGWWNFFDDAQSAFLQWNQPKLCMPFGEFHKRFESWIGRPVFTHEFASKRLLQDELDTGIHPSLSEIMAQIPPEKLITFNPQTE